MIDNSTRSSPDHFRELYSGKTPLRFLVIAILGFACPACSKESPPPPPRQQTDTSPATPDTVEIRSTNSIPSPSPIHLPSTTGHNTAEMEIESGSADAQRPAIDPVALGGSQFGNDYARARGPTYDCSGLLTDVERMVCDDESLAQLERQMVGLYHDRYEASVGRARSNLLSSQRRFLREIGRCQSSSCIASVYQTRIDVLSR